MESASISDVEAHALVDGYLEGGRRVVVDGYLEGGRRVVVDKAVYGACRVGRNQPATGYEVHRAVFRMAAPVRAEIRQGGLPMAEGKQVRPRLFEADLPKDPRKPIRHPFDAVPYTPPDRILDEESLLRRLMAAPDRVLWWPRNCANRLLAERMVEHGWLDGDGARGFTPSDDGAAAIRALDAGRPAPDWNRPLGALF